MKQNNTIKFSFFFVLISITYFLLTLLPFGGLSLAEAKTTIARFERISIFLILLLTLIIFFRKNLLNKIIPLFTTESRLHSSSFLFLLLPLLSYSLVYTLFGYRFAGLPEPDYSGISAALNATVLGDGLLNTAFFATGESGSFLTHHFAPTLLLLTPFYFLANLLPGSTHLLYGLILIVMLAAGLSGWTRLLRIELRSDTQALALLLGLTFSYPLLRIILSFHFELLVLPLSALLFLGVREKNYRLAMVAFILWLGLKDDSAVYLFLFGAYLFIKKEERPLALFILITSAAYFLTVNLWLKSYLGGAAAPDWNYWESIDLRTVNFGSAVDLLLAFAFLPLLSGKLFITVILPVMTLHLFSNHSWHADFYGHYSYTVLPFLLLGYIQGYQRVREWLSNYPNFSWLPLPLSIMLILYSAAGEKETPLPLSHELASPSAVAFRKLLEQLPDESICLQTDSRFLAQTPLAHRLFPINLSHHNPYSKLLPDYLSRNSAESYPVLENCAEYFLIVSDESRDKILAQGSVSLAIRRQLQEIAHLKGLTLFRKVDSER